MNVSPGSFTISKIEKALRRRDEGDPWEDIAADLKCNPDSLQRTCSAYTKGKWKNRNAQLRRHHRAIVKRYEKGMKASQIAKELSLRASAVARVLMREIGTSKAKDKVR